MWLAERKIDHPGSTGVSEENITRIVIVNSIVYLNMLKVLLFPQIKDKEKKTNRIV